MTKTKLRIDHRETTLKDIFASSDIDVSWELLDLGDIIFEFGGGDGSEIETKHATRKIIIERKTLSDLAASIKDGRYKTQKTLLMATYPIGNIYYIIEGDIGLSGISRNPSGIKLDTGMLQQINGISLDTLRSCIFNIMFRDGIKILFSKNTNDTCGIIQELWKRFESTPEKYCVKGGDDASGTCVGTGTVMQPPQRKISSKEECFIAQLCQIPGVSQKSAKAIAQKYQSMHSLIAALSTSGIKALDTVKLRDDPTQKGRALSSSVVKRIHEFMATSNEEK